MQMFKKGRFDLWNRVKAFKAKFELLLIIYWILKKYIGI